MEKDYTTRLGCTLLQLLTCPPNRSQGPHVPLHAALWTRIVHALNALPVAPSLPACPLFGRVIHTPCLRLPTPTSPRRVRSLQTLLFPAPCLSLTHALPCPCLLTPFHSRSPSPSLSPLVLPFPAGICEISIGVGHWEAGGWRQVITSTTAIQGTGSPSSR